MADEGSDEDTPQHCDKCIEAYDALDDFITEPDILWIHIDASFFEAKKKDKSLKKEILHRLKKKVCALRNTNGGCLLIHLKGHYRTSFLGTFDEALEHPLKTLISDGSLLIDNYKRQWMSEISEKFRKYTDFIVLFVCKSDVICTVDYNTKVPTDLQIEDPTFFNFKKLLSKDSTPVQKEPILRGYDISDLLECRRVQLKWFRDEPCDVSTLSDKIWKTYRFREYLSAMSKVEDGGSYYFGVKEGNHEKDPDLTGLTLSEETRAKLESAIRRKLEDAVILGEDGKFTTAEKHQNLIKFDFHNLGSRKFVLQIAVGNVKGFVFYKKGPKAYKVVDENGVKTIEIMGKDEWQEQLFHNLHSWSPVKVSR